MVGLPFRMRNLNDRSMGASKGLASLCRKAVAGVSPILGVSADPSQVAQLLCGMVTFWEARGCPFIPSPRSLTPRSGWVGYQVFGRFALDPERVAVQETDLDIFPRVFGIVPGLVPVLP